MHNWIAVWGDKGRKICKSHFLAFFVCVCVCERKLVSLDSWQLWAMEENHQLVLRHKHTQTSKERERQKDKRLTFTSLLPCFLCYYSHSACVCVCVCVVVVLASVCLSVSVLSLAHPANGYSWNFRSRLLTTSWCRLLCVASLHTHEPLVEKSEQVIQSKHREREKERNTHTHWELVSVGQKFKLKQSKPIKRCRLCLCAGECLKTSRK